LGGNVLLYPFWSELNRLLKKFDFEYHFWINYQNLTETILNECSVLQTYIDVLITFPLNESKLNEIVSFSRKNKNIKLHFLIESTEHFETSMEIINRIDDIETDIVPVYNRNNCSFFEENIYLEKEDIFSEIMSMRKIFCNQKINSNYFGSLTVLPNGDIKANINSNSLGSIYNTSLLDIIYKEMIDNTAWRKVRNSQKCADCLYQFLCPPPSNYEIALGKSYLCHI
jgi:pseudo-rSAM protein